MNIDNSIANLFTEMIKEGFIFIDNNGVIKLYNSKAKQIFGLDKQNDIEHSAGQISKGDIIIIGDNCLGKDDGELNYEDLKKIGITSEDVRLGDAFLGVGVYEDYSIFPKYRSYGHKELREENYELKVEFQGLPIGVRVEKDNIIIRVENEEYAMSYINAIGHMVIIDSISKKVKFYQAAGYTARGESISDILRGKQYLAKGTSADEFDVVSKNIFEIHEGGTTIQEFYNTAKGQNIEYKDKFTNINGFPTICSIFPVEINGERLGAVLRVEDITALKSAISERDEALSSIEEMKKIIDDGTVDYEEFSQLGGESNIIKSVKKLAYKASKTNSTVLILGESGTGKTLLAEAIHKASNNRTQAFIHVNCGAMPESLLESELFGYEKGAFTGANISGKTGFFEKAQGGTIFLDEIGDISLSAQVKLLKVIQNKTFFRIGGEKEITVNVRIITATNKNLEEEIKKGKFREDLYYRLNVFPISMPDLKERKEDISYLSNKFIKQICERLECGEKFISPAAQKCLLEYKWPGNIRELENVIERAANISDGDIIDVNHLPLKIRESSYIATNWGPKNLKDYVNEAEKKAIEEALIYFENDYGKAMKELKMGKTSFYFKLNKYNLK